MQIFVQFPELSIPSQSITISPTKNQTFFHLKQSLFPKSISPQFISSFYFTLNGTPFDDNTPISISQIAPLSTLILRFRSRGGGGDGGATGAESRDCYLNMYAEKKPDKVDPNEQRLSKWLNCALSNEPLREPCVVDRIGNVFNKETLVEALLKKNLPKEFRHIKGLKDMVNVELCLIPGMDNDDSNDNGGMRFQCPISGLEFNGKYKFFALKKCGHVLSAKALKEVKSSSCLVCREDFDEMDKIVINGSEEEVAMLRERMEEERVKLNEKKGKKSKNGVRVSGNKHGVDIVDKASTKVDGNGNGNGATKRFKATDRVPANANKEVYASIFTSSKKSDFKETYSCRSLPLGRN